MNEALMILASEVAGKFKRKWREDLEDIRQEILLWCLENDIDGSIFEDASYDEEEFKAEVRVLKDKMAKVAEKYCRKQKADREGYSPEDEAFYGVKYLEELLEIYFSDGITEHPPLSRSLKRSKNDPAEGGNHLASMVDLSKGLSLIKDHFRERLEVRFGPLAGLSDDAVAGLSQSQARDLTGWHHTRLTMVLGATGDKVRHRTDTALKALQKVLGGRSPYGVLKSQDGQKVS